MEQSLALLAPPPSALSEAGCREHEAVVAARSLARIVLLPAWAHSATRAREGRGLALPAPAPVALSSVGPIVEQAVVGAAGGIVLAAGGTLTMTEAGME